MHSGLFGSFVLNRIINDNRIGVSRADQGIAGFNLLHVLADGDRNPLIPQNHRIYENGSPVLRGARDESPEKALLGFHLFFRARSHARVDLAAKSGVLIQETFNAVP